MLLCILFIETTTHVKIVQQSVQVYVGFLSMRKYHDLSWSTRLLKIFFIRHVADSAVRRLLRSLILLERFASKWPGQIDL